MRSDGRTDLYFDDLKPGDRFVSRAVTMSEADIIGFAKQFDPQPFHIDPEAAKKSHFGGIIASGFHTLAAGFRILYDTHFITTANLGGVGIDELRWVRPVNAGDTLHSTGEILEAIPSKSKPDRGTIRYAFTVWNQKEEKVLTGVFVIVVRRRAT